VHNELSKISMPLYSLEHMHSCSPNVTHQLPSPGTNSSSLTCPLIMSSLLFEILKVLLCQQDPLRLLVKMSSLSNELWNLQDVNNKFGGMARVMSKPTKFHARPNFWRGPPFFPLACSHQKLVWPTLRCKSADALSNHAIELV
jgi:hypothetical protein